MLRNKTIIGRTKSGTFHNFIRIVNYVSTRIQQKRKTKYN